MKRTLFAFLFLLPALLSAQFRIVGTGLFTTVNDSTYRAKIDFRPDLTGFSYNPTQMNDSMYVLSQRGQLYRLDSFYNATFSSAFIVVVEKNGNWGSPVGQVMVFQNNSSLAAPQAVYGANGATAGMQAGVDTWNALLLKVVADSASYWNEAYSAIVDSIWFSGATTKTLNMAQRGGDTLSASFVITGGADSLYVAENTGTTLLTNGDTLDLTAYLTMPFDSITFTTTAENTALEGELTYNNQSGTLVLGMAGGIEMPIGQGEAHIVRNSTGTTIQKGKVVYISGATGQRPQISLSDADTEVGSSVTFGITAEAIAANDSGFVFTSGYIKGINTNSLTEGEALWLDTIPGGFTHTKPTAPVNSVLVGYVITKKSNGTIFVKIQNGYEIDELHNVVTSGKTNNSVIRYDSATALWKASTTAGIVAGDTAAMLTNYINVVDTAAMLTNYVNIADTAAMLTNYINVADTATMLSSYISNADTSVFVRQYQLSGTSGYLPKYTTDTTMGNSVIQESGGNIGISATPSAFKLDINGSTHTTGDFYADRASRSSSAGFVSAQTNNRWLAGMIANSGSWHVYDLLKSTSVMTLDSAASRVGIGTTSPARTLHIEGEARITNLTTDTPTRIVGADADGDLGAVTLGTGLSIASGTLSTSAILPADTSVFVRQYQLSGNSGYLPKYTTDTTLGNSPLYNPSGNKIMLGHTSGNVLTTNIEVHSATSASPTLQSSIDVYMGNNTFADYTPYLQLYRNKGTTVGSVAKVNQGDWLGRLTFQGADGAKYIRAAQIYAITDAATALDSVAASLRFATTANGSTVPTDRMSITSAGRVGIGTTTPDARLNIINTNSTVPALNIVGNTNVNSVDYNAVNVDMSTVGVNGTYTGINVFQSASSDGSNIGYKTSVNARNSAYGVYSTATKIWPGGALFGEAVGVYGSATTTSGLGFSYGGKFENLATSGTGYGLYVNTTSAVSGSVTPFAVAHKGTVRTVIDTVGRVGIGTTSPARTLHIEGEARITNLTTDTPTRIVGADADGDLGAVTLGTGLSIASGTLSTSAILPADTSVFVRQYQLSGNSGYLPKYTTDTTLGNSPIYNVANNQLVIGHNAVGTGAKNVLEIRGTGNTDFDGSKVDLYVNSSGQDYHSPIISLRRSRGATAGAFTKAEYNDWLGQLLFNGADGDEYTGGAGIRAVVDSITGNNDMPASLYFLTTPNGSASLTTRMTINNAGRVGIGTTSPSRTLHVEGEARISGLTTDTPTRIVGADADGDLGAVTLGTGLSIASGTLNTSAILPADTSVFVRQYQLSGTSGYLPRYTSDTTMGNSVVYQHSGNIGINSTTATNNKFQIGDVGTTGYAGNDLAIGNGTGVMAIEQTGTLTKIVTNKDFSFMPAGVGATGRVGIGTTTPVTELDVNGTLSFNNVQTMGTATASSKQYINLYPNPSTEANTVNLSTSASTATLKISGGVNQPGGQIELIGGGAASDAGEVVLRSGVTTSTTPAPERIRIKSDGKVGIGTATPDSTLHVVGDAKITGGASFVNGDVSIGPKLANTAFSVHRTYAGTVTNPIRSVIQAYVPNNSINAYNLFKGVGGNTFSGGVIYGLNLEFINTNGGAYGIYSQGETQNYFSGKVGIGTTSPARSLHIAATDAVRIPAGSNTQRTPSGVTNAIGDLRYNTEDSVENIEWYDVTGAWRRPVISASATGLGTDGRLFYANSSGLAAADEPLHWDYNNNRLGIGVASPTAPLDVLGGGKFSTVIEVPNIRNGTTANNVLTLAGNAAASGNTATSENIVFNVGNNGATRAMTILNNGRVGIGTASPDSLLTVNGAIRATILAVRNASPSQVMAVNNYAASGTNGNNVWIGNGGQKVSGTGSQGSSNVGIGIGALLNNTTGTGNTAIGINAMFTNTTGDNNMALGGTALNKNTSGYVNVAIGNQSLQENTTGYSNLAIGYAALNKNTEGQYNNAIGSNALSLNTTGSDNTGIGGGSLENNLTGGSNVAIGRSAMYSNTTASYNDVIGNQALYSANSEGNQAIGFRALYALTSGSYNIGIGFEAGRYVNAGGANQTSTQSIYIGTDSRASLNGNTREIVIGYGARGNGSNTTTIGNSSTVGTYFQYGETYIGTATDNGAFKLQVDGGARIDDEIRYTNRPAAAAVTNIGVDANGIIREATSSQRFKYNISPYEKGLADIMRLTPKWYTYNGDIKANAGFIAEDVSDAGLSEYVVYDAENKPYSLQYGNMVALLTKAIQEQQAQIEALKKEIEQLKNK